MPVSSWRVLNTKSRSLPPNRTVSQKKFVSVRASRNKRKASKNHESSNKLIELRERETSCSGPCWEKQKEGVKLDLPDAPREEVSIFL